jgi:hypothetical protein
MHRTIRSFERMMEIWIILGNKRSDNQSTQLIGGYRAFAYRQASMYTKLADAARKNRDIARLGAWKDQLDTIDTN